MKIDQLRGSAIAVVLMAATTVVAVVASSPPASAETGGCPDLPHNVHTSDTAPYRGWACWIDNGDKIRVCDHAPNDGVHVHAEFALDFGYWHTIIAEDDGPDDGCDEESAGDLENTQHVRLRVCAQREDQTNFNCANVTWVETE